MKLDLVELAAEAAHEMNRVYCASMGDYSQPIWADAPEWQKSSARMGVRAVIDNPNQTGRDSHEGWLKVKRAEGWTYGPTKDVAAKTHPCMVPYEELPIEQQKKDYFFIGVVRLILDGLA